MKQRLESGIYRESAAGDRRVPADRHLMSGTHSKVDVTRECVVTELRRPLGNDCRAFLMLVRRGFETTLLSGAAGILSILFVSILWHGQGSALEQHSQQTSAPPGLTLDGDVALWTVSIKPDKTDDFEKIVTKLRDGLLQSEKLERKQQAAGWKVMRISKPLPDGNVVYVHIINPVVRGADYSVMQTLYDEFPEEREALYELYRGAFAQNLSLATGTVVLDMSKAE